MVSRRDFNVYPLLDVFNLRGEPIVWTCSLYNPIERFMSEASSTSARREDGLDDHLFTGCSVKIKL